jgi:class 3 adenylate cyclase
LAVGTEDGDVADIPDTGTPNLIHWAGGPRATLAITFTDIVDSTATADDLGDESMHEVWTEHFEQSRKLITAYSGRWIKNLGDGDLAVFRTAEEALDYARALHVEPAPRYCGSAPAFTSAPSTFLRTMFAAVR